jgi:microcystin-dependent protein
MQNLTGEIQLVPGSLPQENKLPCNGQIVLKETYIELFYCIAHHYGGGLDTNFCLPDFKKSDDGIKYNISTGLVDNGEQCFGINKIGEIGYTGAVDKKGNSIIPEDWIQCDGAILNISENTLLYEVITNMYGGNAKDEKFALPTAPSLYDNGGLRGDTIPLIRIVEDANFPQPNQCVLGSLVLWPGANPLEEKFWMRCDGKLMDISANTVLYLIIGTQFGGDGEKTFALPNLKLDNDMYYFICISGIFPNTGE